MARKLRRSDSRTVVDLLPPYGAPEVETTGRAALLVGLFAVAVTGVVALFFADE